MNSNGLPISCFGQQLQKLSSILSSQLRAVVRQLQSRDLLLL
jgi:hypothetical protein